MVRLTLIARARDGLPLAEGLDTDKDAELETYKHQAKGFFKKLAQSNRPPPHMTLEAGKCVFHSLVKSDVCFLTLADKSYPKKLAFQFLEELHNEFSRLYGSQLETVTRPYAFIKFDTFIQRTKKLYVDTRTQRNMAKLNEDLSEVHQIMTKNISEVLAQGEKLEDMAQMSRSLAAESKRYSSRAAELHRQALIRKYAPWVVVAVMVLLVLWFRTLYR